MKKAKIISCKQDIINIHNKKYNLTPTDLQICTSINNVFLKSKGNNGIIKLQIPLAESLLKSVY